VTNFNQIHQAHDRESSMFMGPSLAPHDRALYSRRRPTVGIDSAKWQSREAIAKLGPTLSSRLRGCNFFSSSLDEHARDTMQVLAI
jgi:hypothetical protein